MADEPRVYLGADFSGLFKALADASGAIKGLSGQFSAMGASMSAAVSAVKGPLLALGAILEGGRLFGGAVKATEEWTLGVRKLSSVLGVSLEMAGAYRLSMDQLGISQDRVVSIAQRLVMRAEAQSLKFRKLGVDVRDATTYALKPAAEIMHLVTEKANSLGDGAARAAFLSQTMGRGWVSSIEVLRLTRKSVEDARKELEEFGVVTTQAGVAGVREYKESMHKLGEAFRFLEIQLGNQLLPVLADMSKELGKAAKDSFPALMHVMVTGVTAIDFLVTAFRSLGAALAITVLPVVLMIKLLTTLWGAFYAFSLDPEGGPRKALSILREGFSDMANVSRETVNGMIGDQEKLWGRFTKRSVKLLNMADLGTSHKKSGAEGEKSEGDATGDASRFYMQESQALLKEQHATHHVFLDEELSFWGARLKFAKEHGSTFADAILDMEVKLQGLRFKKAQERLKSAEDEFKTLAKMGDQRLQTEIEIARQVYAMERDSKTKSPEEKKAALNVLAAAEWKYVEDLKRAATELVDFDAKMRNKRRDLVEQEIAFRESMGEISGADKIGMLRASAEAEQAVLLNDLAVKQALYAEGSTERLKVDREIEAAKQDHFAKMAGFDRQAIEDERKNVNLYLDPIKNSFKGLFDSIIDGTSNFHRSMVGMLKALAKAVAGHFIEMGAAWLSGAIAQKTAEKGLNLSKVLSSLAVAEAEAGAWGAALGGPVGAAVAIAEIDGIYAPIVDQAVARGGFDIGAFEAPVTQLHPREMVLPAALADKIRNMTDGGAGNVPPTVNVHFNLSGMDGKDVYRTFKSNETMIVKALREAMADGRL